MVAYLFPGAMYKRLVQVNLVNQKIISIAPNTFVGLDHILNDVLSKHPFLKDTNKLYQLALKQYFGFGALLQFIPGSKIQKIRKQFSLELEEAILDLQNQTSLIFHTVSTHHHEHYFSDYSQKEMQRWAMVYHLQAYMNPSRLIRLAHELISAFHIRGALYNLKQAYKLVIAPFPNDVAQHFTDETLFTAQNFVNNFFRSLINPFRLINGLLFFTQILLFKILDLKTRQNERSPLPRMIVKGFLGLFFGTIRFPIILCKFAWDLPLTAIRIFLLQPIAHILESIVYTFKHRNEKVVIGQVNAFRAIHKKDEDFFEIQRPKFPNKYFGATEYELDDKTSNEIGPSCRSLSDERFIACRGETKRMNTLSKQLSKYKITHFKLSQRDERTKKEEQYDNSENHSI